MKDNAELIKQTKEIFKAHDDKGKLKIVIISLLEDYTIDTKG